MNADDFIEKLHKEAVCLGVKEFQISYSYYENYGLSLVDGKLEKVENNQEQMIKFMVRHNGKLGQFVYEGDLKLELIPMIVKTAQENVSLISDEDDSFFYAGGEYVKDLKPYQPLWDKLQEIDKIDFLKQVEKLVYDKSSLVNKVISTHYGEVKNEVILRNSLGLNVSKKLSRASASVHISVKNDDEIKSAVEMVDFSDMQHFNLQYLVDKVVDTAINKLKGREFQSGKYKVVLKNKAVKSLLSVIASLFFAQSVIDKKTKFGDKIGQKIASDKVSIIENPFMEGGYATCAFDGEGYPTSYKLVVEKGVLQTLLYDLKTANKFEKVSTGNFDFLGNFYLEKGSLSFDGLLREMGEGILIEELSGFNVGIDKVSGDFSLVGNGKKVEAGTIAYSLSPFTVSGNLYQLLMDISNVANDLDFYYSSCGAPSVIVNELVLANS